MNIFEQIRKDTERRKVEHDEKHSIRQYEKRMETAEAERRRDLKNAAKEFAGMFKDKRYPHWNAFQEKLVVELRDASDKHGMSENDPNKLALESARISAQIELLNYLRDYPVMVVSQLRRESTKGNS